jgi:hypothetical protein
MFMKKRVVSLLLCLAMLLSALALSLTGCGSTKEEEEEKPEQATDDAATLVMWCVTESAKVLDENGNPVFDAETDKQMKDVVKEMTAITQSKLKTKLIVKYFTMEEYREKLEEAFLWQQAEAKRREEAKDKGNKNEVETPEVEEEEEDDGKIKYDEDGNPIIDTTKYPTLTEDQLKYQVDILYISGYDQYMDYIAGYGTSETDTLKALVEKLFAQNRITQEEYAKADKLKTIKELLNKLIAEERLTQSEIDAYSYKKWLAPLNSELSGGSKKISSFVSSSLINSTKYKNTVYAIPNNNVIGEYTYMLIDKELFDKYYHTASLDSIYSVADLGSFLEDVKAYEDGVLPINADVNDCMSMIAHYWDVDPKTLAITGDFSVLGYTYKSTDRVNRGEIVLKFDNLFKDDAYLTALRNLMAFKYEGYFGTAEEGQRSAVSFVKGSAADAAAYAEDYYTVVVDYPLASSEDIYGNMFAVSAYSSNIKKSMQVITLLNTDVQFRNLFQYGIEGTNYTRHSDGTVSYTNSNKYLMDIAKTGNEFLAYIPQGTDPSYWEYAKLQNRESLVDPLLGLDFAAITGTKYPENTGDLETDILNTLKNDADSLLDDESDLMDINSYKYKEKKSYMIETVDTDQIKFIANLSDAVWERIEKCKDVEAFDKEIEKLLEKELNPEMYPDLWRAMQFEVTPSKFDPDGKVSVDPATKQPLVPNPTIVGTMEPTPRYEVATDENGNVLKDEDGKIIFTDVMLGSYEVYRYKINLYQLYYRWMQEYSYLPK